MIRDVAIEDAAAICEIYNHYVANTIVTFDEGPTQLGQMQAMIAEVTSAYPWYVWEEGGKVVGYACARRWHERSAYRFAAQGTVYLHPDWIGKGMGRQLYQRVISEVRSRGFHSLIGSIALPNEASVALHEKLGFVKVGHLKEVGWKFDRWIDVGYWELPLQGPTT
jgi:L-amino acid N-acyltransferase YncA